MSQLRPYQSKIIADARALMTAGHRSMLVTSPTGSGKTLLTAHMLKTAASKGLACLFLVHRRELVKQSIRAFAGVGVNYGVIANGFSEDYRSLVQIASVQTLTNRLAKIKRPRLIVYDECHHVAAGSWSKIYSAFPDAFHIGLTATPARLDGTGLGKWFSRMIHGPSVQWLIENGFLSEYRLYAPPSANLVGVHTRMGDFVKSELSAVLDKPTITGDAIKHYRKLADGKRAVVFCVSVQHSKHVVAQFQAAGIPAAHVDGETDANERDAAIRSFETGRTRVLSNVELFGEGFDLPAIEVAVLLRPTQSLGLYLQQVGRVLRPAPGKTAALILDHAGNCERHGLPDEERVWSLDGSPRSGRTTPHEAVQSVRVCPRCFGAQVPGRLSCTYCGHPFEVKGRKVEEAEGELVEVDPTVIRAQRRKEQSSANSLESLIELGKERGYKRPLLWARHVWMARQRKTA